MNVLLTGGTGYIGSHTAVALIEAGHRVVLFDNFSNSRPDVVRRLGTITGQPVDLVEGDVRSTALVTQTIEAQDINAVIHFAGLKAVGESVTKPIDYYDNNVQGTLSLLQAMQATGLRTLVFSSSATVYGEPRYVPIDEDHPTSATNPYGRSKLHVEEMLADVAQSDESWRIACLRYFNPTGAHESSLIGEEPSGIPNNLMPYVAQVAFGTLPYLKVFGDDYSTPDGTGVRDYVHVLDLAAGHLSALGFLNTTSGWHAINLGTGQGYSVLQIVKTFEATSGRNIPYQVCARRSGDVAVCYAKTDRALHQLNWQAHRTLEEMCSSTWHWQEYCASLES